MVFTDTVCRIINGDCRDMSVLADKSIDLVVTSPPYWQIKDYGNDGQIGFNDNYEEYIDNLNIVWQECHRVLDNGRRLCVNIGDQFTRTADYGRHKIIPIHAEIIRFCETIGFDYMGEIIWKKQANMQTSGGAVIMGSYPYPCNGLVKYDFEYILLFKKLGESTREVDAERKEMSKMTNKEWNTYFTGHWNIPGAKQDEHIAMFPDELPKRLVRMFSFVGDTVLDPFTGSGTTIKAAREQFRNGIGFEVNPDFIDIIAGKVGTGDLAGSVEFEKSESVFDMEQKLNLLPYRFVDVRKIGRKEGCNG